MTDSKKQHDIVAKAGDEPEVLSDDSLDDAQGGLHIGQAGLVSNTVLSGGTTMLTGDPGRLAIYGGTIDSEVLDRKTSLETKPTRMPDPYSGI